MKQRSDYQDAIGAALYERTPKAVFAAIATSALTIGGDLLSEAPQRILREWWALYEAGVVPQRPPQPDPGPGYSMGCRPEDQG